MPLDVVSPRRENETKRVDDLLVYLIKVGGSDILEYADSACANAAAHALRARCSEVSVEARYNKVFLKVKVH